MKSAAGNGRLIAFCGIDGCGKTTQLKLAEKWLLDRGYSVLATKQPSDFYRKHPAVRNFFRTNLPEGGMESLVMLSALDRQFHLRTVIEPALTVYLDIPGRVCHERIHSRDGSWSSVEEQDLGFLEKVRLGFEGAADETFLRIDGLQSIESIHETVVKGIAGSLEESC